MNANNITYMRPRTECDDKLEAFEKKCTPRTREIKICNTRPYHPCIPVICSIIAAVIISATTTCGIVPHFLSTLAASVAATFTLYYVYFRADRTNPGNLELICCAVCSVALGFAVLHLIYLIAMLGNI